MGHIAEENPYPSLRSRIFEVSPEELGLEDELEGNKPFAFITELYMANTLVTVVVIGDGSISLYFENGTIVIGGGEHEEILNIGFSLLGSAQQLSDRLVHDVDLNHPKKNRVKYFIRTKDFVASCELNEENLTKENIFGAYQYMATHAIISEFRKIDEGKN